MKNFPVTRADEKLAAEIGTAWSSFEAESKEKHYAASTNSSVKYKYFILLLSPPTLGTVAFIGLLLLLIFLYCFSTVSMEAFFSYGLVLFNLEVADSSQEGWRESSV